ncbi:MAG: TolC family protein, partial [Acidobacteria bacterium]|nr:TolC family protein [Acidobacteriota bacterium]
MSIAAWCAAALLSTASIVHAQQPPALPGGPPLTLMQPEAPTAPPAMVTLQDALDRARQNDAQFQTAIADAQVAREDRVQAKALLLPAISYTTQYLGNSPTPNNVNPNGRFVSLDGVKMYRAWGVLHQDLSPNVLMKTP